MCSLFNAAIFISTYKAYYYVGKSNKKSIIKSKDVVGTAVR